jgi:hypothetical protein
MVTSSEQLTFFAAASHASLSVWPGSRQANQMTVTSGLRLLESLPSCDRGLWWLKTLLASSAWRSTRCSLTWKHKVTPQGRSYFLLRVSMPRTAEIASGLWPSPQHHDHVTGYAHRVGRYGTKHGGRNLNDTVALLPTPRHEGFDAGGHRGKPDSLHSHAKMFPTPTAQSAKHGTPSPAQMNRVDSIEAHVFGAILPTPVTTDHKQHSSPAALARKSPQLVPTVGSNAATGMKLNPDWVARMMGLPDGWLDVGTVAVKRPSWSWFPLETVVNPRRRAAEADPQGKVRYALAVNRWPRTLFLKRWNTWTRVGPATRSWRSMRPGRMASPA